MRFFWRNTIFFGTFHFLSSFLRASFILEYSLRFGFKYMALRTTHIGDSDVGDFMMVTDFGCWWQNQYVGDFVRYVGDFLYVLNRSPTSKTCHQHIWSPTSVTNVDVTEVWYQFKTLPYFFWREFNFFFDIVSVARNCWYCWRHHLRRFFNRCRLHGGLSLYKDLSVPSATAMLARLYFGEI